MGQISDGVNPPSEDDVTWLRGNEAKHICDIEGDWTDRLIPDWLRSCTLTINGAKQEYQGVKMFIRPTFSFLLIDLYRRDDYVRGKLLNKSFGFRGYPDPRGVRAKLKVSFEKSGLKGEYVLNDSWQAQNLPTSNNTALYIQTMTENIFSLCPLGAGVDSIRFFESCYFGSIPVVVSNNFIPFEDSFREKFYFRIDPALSIEEVRDRLIAISSTSHDELNAMSCNAQSYFRSEVKTYFDDPTLKFLKWFEGQK
jgi:hypothetical protein